MRGALEQAAAEVEESRGVPVEVVAVGDCDLDTGGDAIVAAAREAMLNAAKFGGGSTVDVFAELADGRRHVFVARPRPRLRPGSDPRATAAECASRSSGAWRATAAAPRSTARPAEGTEVELMLEGDT